MRQQRRISSCSQLHTFVITKLGDTQKVLLNNNNKNKHKTLRASCNVSCSFYVKMTDESFSNSFIIIYNYVINFLRHTEVNAFTFRFIYLRHKCSRRQDQPKPINIESKEFEQVKSFTYLGSTVNTHNTTED
jgi:hypothetical protein